MTNTTGRILAIDYGSKRVGLAVSDPMRIISQGAGTIENDPTLVDRIARFVEEQDISLIVVGMPFAPDGGIGTKGEEIQRFVRLLHEAVSVGIETWDESFSSVRAQQVFRETGMRRKQRREKHRVDEMAARLLLQEYLESKEHQR
jgi:putative Holliday junction resolvase